MLTRDAEITKYIMTDSWYKELVIFCEEWNIDIQDSFGGPTLSTTSGQIETGARAGNLVLAQTASVRYAIGSSLYFAQGIPAGLLSIALPAWLVSVALFHARIRRHYPARQS